MTWLALQNIFLMSESIARGIYSRGLRKKIIFMLNSNIMLRQNVTPRGYSLIWAIYVINRGSILAILILNRVWCLHSSLELNMLF